MIGKLIKRIMDNHKTPEKIVVFIISGIVAIIVSVFLFNNLDRIPATSEDFEELHEQIKMIQDNPEEILNHNGKITVSDDKITYEIENKECKMIGEYTRDYKLLQTTKVDNAISIYVAILICAAVGTLVFLLSTIGLCEFIIIVGILYILIINIYKKLRKQLSQ